MMRGLILAAVGLVASGTNGRAEPLPAFTDPSQAGADFQVQGEYVGRVGNQIPVGLQVIALGKQRFQGVLYTGGLPGAGWNESTVFHIQGQSENGRCKFHGIHGERLAFPNANFHGALDQRVLTGEARMYSGLTDDVSFRLQKVLRKSPTLGRKPPAGALVLFDGKHVDHWQNGRLVDDRLLDVGTTTKRSFGSVLIHLEFNCPFMPTARGMQRGNSGIYIKREWEVQIIDSFGWHHENHKFERLSKFARCGGIHEMVGPRINMSFPPLSWQTYDIEFTAAAPPATDRKTAPAMISVQHNGITFHDKFVLPPAAPGRPDSATTAGRPGPIFLQDHGNPVRFRNIWVVERPSS